MNLFSPKNNSALALAISVLVFVGIVFTFNFAGWRDSFLTAAAPQKPASKTLTITTTSLPNGIVGSTYSATINATGGKDSYVWSIAEGTLSAGLTLSVAACKSSPCQAPAVISGTPTQFGTSTFTIKVTSGKLSASKTFSLVVNPAPSITITSNSIVGPSRNIIVGAERNVIGAFDVVLGGTQNNSIIQSFDLDIITDRQLSEQQKSDLLKDVSLWRGTTIIASDSTAYESGRYPIRFIDIDTSILPGLNTFIVKGTIPVNTYGVSSFKLKVTGVSGPVLSGLLPELSTMYVITTSQPSVTVNGTPTLALTYDSLQKESALTATFNVAVNGGSQGVNVFMNSATACFTLNGGCAYTNSNTLAMFTLSSTTQTGVDGYGRSYAIVPAGQVVTLKVVNSQNPQQMFSGTYTATLLSLYGHLNTAPLGTDINLSVPANQTNAVTIIGETSPYIASVDSPITVDSSGGMKVVIKGVRFSPNNNSIMIGTKEFPGFASKENGTLIDLYLSGLGITPGSQQLYVTNSDMGSAAGKSNVVWVNITGGVTQPSVNFSLNGIPTATVITVGSNTGTTTLTFKIPMKATVSGGTLLKPIPDDFVLRIASTTNASEGYRAGTTTPGTVATFAGFSPSDSTVPDGGSYTFTLLGIITNRLFNGTAFAGPGNYRMVLTQALSSVSGNTIIQIGQDPSSGIFQTPSAYLPN